MRRKTLLHSSLLLSLALAVSTVKAQNSQSYLNDLGSTAYGINIPVENGFINVSNGNLHLEFPLASHPQRGALSLNARITYDSRIWMFSPFGTLGSYHWWPYNVPGTSTTSGGWQFVRGDEVGGITSSVITTNQYECPGQPDSGTWVYTSSANPIWTDPTGSIHPFNAVLYQQDETACGGSFTSSLTSGNATDGSGYSMSDDGTGNPIIIDNNGTQMYPQNIDRYGNYWSTDPQGNLMDSTGRVPVITTVNGNVTTYDVLAPNGTINNNGMRVRYTVTTASVPVATNFQQSDTYEWNPTIQYLTPVTSILLPDRSQYTFTYDSYGELSSVTLPTRGVVQYGYSNFVDSSNTSNRWLTSRAVGNNPAMTFKQSVGTTCANYSTGCKEYVIVQKPSGDSSLYELTLANGAWNTGQVIYTGGPVPIFSGGLSSAIGNTNPNLVPLVFTTAVNSYSNVCSGPTCIGANYLTQSLTTKELFANGTPSVSSQTVTTFSALTGKPSSVKEWDYAPAGGVNTAVAPTTTPSRETDYFYAGNDISQVKVLDSAGNQAGLTTYGYTSTATATPGYAQHGTQNAGGPYLQTVSHWLNTGGSSTTTYTMWDTGQIASVQDPNQNPTTNFTYQCQGSLPGTVTSPLIPPTTYVYDCSSGAVLSVKDPNDAAAIRSGTVYAYEAVAGRPYSISYPDGGGTTYTYPSSTEVDTATTVTPNLTITSADTVDSFGRPYQHSSGGITTETTYDVNGRTYSVTNPHTSSSNNTDGTTYILSYDGLDRPLTQQNPDLSTVSWKYSANATTATDERTLAWTRTVDAFGHLKSVLEPGMPSASATTYSYDGLGNVQIITQPGVASNSELPHVRTFTYDSMARLICAFHPESSQNSCPTSATGSLPSGVMSYSYYPAGNVHTSTDARGVTTTFTYDALNRLKFKTYSDGMSTSAFGYDGKDATGATLGANYGASSNVIGRLTYASNTVNADQGFGYDAMGRMVSETYCLPDNCGNRQTVSASYDLAGNMTSLTYPDGTVISQTYDCAGRLHRVIPGTVSGSNDCSAPATGGGSPYLSSATYNSDGSPYIQTFGNSVQQTTTENNRLQSQSTVVASTLSALSSSPFVSRTYCYSASCATGRLDNNGNIWGITDARNSAHTQGFTYDSLNRISSFSLGGAVNQQYTIDSFGNMSLMSGGSALTHFDLSTSRISNLPCAGSTTSFDNAGNQRCDTDPNGGVRQYQYDAESRITQIASLGSSTPFETYTYDSNGTRVRKTNADTTFTEYVNFNGQPIAEKDQNGYWTDYIYANGRKIAKAVQSESVIKISGTASSTSDYEYFPIVNNGPLNSYTVQAGDHLHVRQRNHGTAHGGVEFDTDTAGTSVWTLTNVAQDQDGLSINNDTTAAEVWHDRVIDLSSMAGNHLSQIYCSAYGTGSGAWSVDFTDYAIFSANGDVHPLYTGAGGVSAGAWGSSGMSGIGFTIASVATDAAATHYYAADHLGSTQSEFSSGGYPTWKGEFAPFGQELSAPTTAMHYKFTGLERDKESGLDHTMFRQYASNAGRWMSPDPYDGSMDFGNPQSLNRYSYVSNMPLTQTDPLGLEGGGASCGFVCGVVIAGDALITLGLEELFSHSKFTASHAARPGAIWDEHGGIQPHADIAGALGLPSGGGCEFGACGNSFQNPVGVGTAAAACIEAEPCGAIAGTILGLYMLYDVWHNYHSQPTIEASSPQERRNLDWVARAFCVDRKALGDAIHREKIGRQKGKGSDLTLDEIKDLARYLPKIPGCTPTAF